MDTFVKVPGSAASTAFRISFNCSDCSTPQILLVPYVLVRRHENFKAGRLCGIKQFTVLQSIPPIRSTFFYGMAAEGASDCSWRTVVEQNAHSEAADRYVEAAGSKFQHRLDFLTGDGELFDDFVDGHPMLKVFKHNRNWRTTTLEQPCAANFAGDSLNGRAL
jgi:hypothetical protein